MFDIVYLILHLANNNITIRTKQFFSTLFLGLSFVLCVFLGFIFLNIVNTIWFHMFVTILIFWCPTSNPISFCWPYCPFVSFLFWGNCLIFSWFPNYLNTERKKQLNAILNYRSDKVTNAFSVYWLTDLVRDIIYQKAWLGELLFFGEGQLWNKLLCQIPFHDELQVHQF